MISKWNDNINHQAYVDDIVIFIYTDKKSLQLIMDTFRDYEAQYG